MDGTSKLSQSLFSTRNSVASLAMGEGGGGGSGVETVKSELKRLCTDTFSNVYRQNATLFHSGGGGESYHPYQIPPFTTLITSGVPDRNLNTMAIKIMEGGG